MSLIGGSSREKRFRKENKEEDTERRQNSVGQGE